LNEHIDPLMEEKLMHQAARLSVERSYGPRQ